MPEFKNKEEYEKWKAERARELKENPKNITEHKGELKSHEGTRNALSGAKRIYHNWRESSQQRSTERELRR